MRLVRRIECLAVGVGVGLGDRLGEVLGQVPDRPVRILARGDDALDVDLAAEPHHHPRLRLGVGVELVERLLPRRQRNPAAVLDPLGGRVPGRHRFWICADRGFERGPPQLQVRRLGDGADHPPRDRTADRQVDVRGQPALRLDGAEVLHPVAGTSAQVLHPPVEQLREVQRLHRCSPIVVTARPRRGAGARHDRPVGAEGQGDEHRRAVRRPVRRGERSANTAVFDRRAGQINRVLAATGRPHPARCALGIGAVVVVVVIAVDVAVGLVILEWVLLKVPALGALLHP
jgi:hypothetical protein